MDLLYTEAVEVTKELERLGYPSLTVVETTAGGLISQALVSVPGASKWFDAGVVLYGKAGKQHLLSLGSAPSTGWVSEEGAEAIAISAVAAVGSTIVLAETSIAPPKAYGARSSKPVGTSYVSVAYVRAGEVRCSTVLNDLSSIVGELTRPEAMDEIALAAIRHLKVTLSKMTTGEINA